MLVVLKLLGSIALLIYGQVKADDVKSKAYTMQGTLAQAGQRGIVIENGKKKMR